MLSALKKQLQQERRTGPRAALPASPPAVVLPAGEPEPLPPLSPADAVRLAAVATCHPRLHESLSALDSVQLAAVLNEEESLLVRAPVGSGKTTVLVHKVLYLHLVLGVPLRQMAVLTFTNRAAAEIRTRIAALSEHELSSDDFWLTGTFHGVARALLSRVLPIAQLGYRPDFAVLDETEQEQLCAELIRTHRLRIGRRSQLRHKLRQVSEGQTVPTGDLARLAELITQEKQRRNAMDFDDLITHAAKLLPAPGLAAVDADDPAAGESVPGLQPPSWLIVDEMQDCEPRELALLARLRGPQTKFFAVGDPYQAIYGWRGSVPEVFAQAEATFGCRPLALPRNYRSTRTIVDGARAVLGLQSAAGSLPGALSAVRSYGEPMVIRRHHDPISEALYLAERITRLYQSGVPYGELAVLFRLRAQAEPIRAALTARNIPCREPDDAAGDVAGDAVRLLTLHAAKGLEFRQVFLSGINEGLMPLGHHFEICGDAEERRLLFVGITRARDRVEISYHTRPHEFSASGEPSRYLAWIPRALVVWEDESPADSVAAPAAPAEVAPVPASEPPPTAAPTVGPWQPGQSVRHPRYGLGVVTHVAAGTVDCTFGKFGERSFPLALCPLVAADPTAS